MGLTSLITGTIIVVAWLKKVFPPWYVWLGFVLIIFGIIWLSFLPYYNRVKHKPTIQVVPEKSSSGHYYLLVHNMGERAEFKARVEIMDGKKYLGNVLTEYSASWEETENVDNIPLNKGDKTRLLIAKLQTQEGTQGANFMRNWQLYGHFYKDNADKLPSISSSSWVVKIKPWVGERTPITITWSPAESDEKEMPPQIVLRVTITSHPSMLENFIKNYQLTVDGLAEVNDA